MLISSLPEAELLALRHCAHELNTNTAVRVDSSSSGGASLCCCCVHPDFNRNTHPQQAMMTLRNHFSSICRYLKHIVLLSTLVNSQSPQQSTKIMPSTLTFGMCKWSAAKGVHQNGCLSGRHHEIFATFYICHTCN